MILTPGGLFFFALLICLVSTFFIWAAAFPLEVFLVGVSTSGPASGDDKAALWDFLGVEAAVFLG